MVARPDPRLGPGEGAVSALIAILLLVSIVVLLAGIVYALSTTFVHEANTDSAPGIAQSETRDGVVKYLLVTEGPKAPYNLDFEHPTGNDLKFLVNGYECSFSLGELTVDGPDALWDLGERVTLMNDCEGNSFRPFLAYSVTVVLAGAEIYQDHEVIVTS